MELLIVLLVVLLILGPERLPQVARVLGRIMAELRRAGDEVRVHLDPDLDIYRNARDNLQPEDKKNGDEHDSPSSEEPAGESSPAEGKPEPDDPVSK